MREPPYLQSFLGFHEYRDAAPFDASMMTYFRQRLSRELLSPVNQHVVNAALVEAVSGPPEDEDEPTRPLAPHRSLQAPGPCWITQSSEIATQGPGASGEL